jgi:CPA2 family monovalent cation:H+ antiporter-2
LGAFLAGMILSGSALSQRAAEESLPLRDAFAVLFFVSVGMLFNPLVALKEPLELAITFLVVMAGGGIAFLLLRLFKVETRQAAIIAVSLAQIGEFSFILADLGTGLGVLPAGARGLILGASLLSILVNPLVFALLGPERETKTPLPKPVLRPTGLSGHIVLVGYGRVGSLIAKSLKDSGRAFLVIEDAAGAGERLTEAHIEHIDGNGAKAEVLTAANIKGAALLLVAIPESFEAGQIVEQARAANPNLRIVARAHFDAEVAHLLDHGANQVVMGEREIAAAMLGYAGQQG